MNSTSLFFSNISNSDSTESCIEEPQHVSITVFLSIVFFVGFVLNAFSLWVFTCRMPQWSPGTVLQFHLAVSDAIVSPVAPFMATYFSLGSHWPFGSFLCQAEIALLTIHFYGSILFLTLISIQRYVAVVHFSRISCMKRKSFLQKLCAAVWFLVLAKGAACFALLDTSTAGNRTQCLSIHQGQHTDVYFTLNFILLIPGFLVPFSVSLFCYTRLASSVSRINTNNEKGRAIKAKSRKMVAVCLLIFGLCFMPMNVVRTIGVVIKKFFPEKCNLLLRVETAYYICWILAGANCSLDPILYCFGSQKFSKAVHSSLRRIGFKMQTIPEGNELECQAAPHLNPVSMTETKENMSSAFL
ncbi:P2Y purinoceptor 2-like [Chanos chanos]|uniref:P2Y purinoceptor 2-like n=1 Tax=Chanos chanos TaxID=29144 RepID=A0A6J2WTN7_CHACN|nr:P2Y purinoceptor 2-like [Chanos chanos]